MEALRPEPLRHSAPGIDDRPEAGVRIPTIKPLDVTKYRSSARERSVLAVSHREGE